MADLRQNTWSLGEWYDQAVAGTQGDYSGEIQLWAWGRNNFGQLGVNNRTYNSSPVQIPGTTWTTPIVSGAGAGNFIQAALKTDGTLWCWGENSSGELGQNNTTKYSSPVQVGSNTTWAGGAIGRKSQCQVKTDGTLWTWGSNVYGQLMHNNRTQYSSPKQIPGTTWSGASGKISGSLGGTITLIKTDGTMWSAGRNDEGGEIGDNANISRSSPTQIFGGGTNWTKVSRGQNHTFAIKTDGTLWAWGHNGSGRLGQNNLTKYSSPVQIPGTTWADVSATSKSSYGIKTDGTLWSWGNNYGGALGHNQPTNTHYSSPKQIPGTTWSQLARGGVSNIGAIKTDGTLWVWGSQTYGALGLNERGDYPGYPGSRSSPTQLPGTAWSQLSGTDNGFFAIKNV